MAMRVINETLGIHAIENDEADDDDGVADGELEAECRPGRPVDHDGMQDLDLPVSVQTFLWGQIAPFIRPKLGKVHEATCMVRTYIARIMCSMVFKCACFCKL